MKLECDDSECDLEHVTPDVLDAILASEAFGNFAILSASTDDYLQLISDWEDSDACRDFIAAHGTEPWILILSEGASGQRYQGSSPITIAEARPLFQHYLAGETAWRSQVSWEIAADDDPVEG